MFLVLVVPPLDLCNQRDAFWVQICPVIRTQRTTPLIYLAKGVVTCKIKSQMSNLM